MDFKNASAMMENDDYVELRSSKEVKGRGTGDLAKGRFETLQTLYVQEEEKQIKTEVFKDHSRSIISYNDSPDLCFNASLNPYRGCEHGCIYCYARPTHEYLGFSLGLDFETKLFAKMDAPALLRKALNSKSYKPQVLIMSGVTDCYQPIERELKLSRACLELLAEYRNPVAIITKNHLVTRDIDILSHLNKYNAVRVIISLTTLDKELAQKMEPRASSPARRLSAIKTLTDAGIPVSVNMAPIIPSLTDHEIARLLETAARAGAQSANYSIVRLPYGVKDIFKDWLERNFPDRMHKVLHRIMEVRGGKLNTSTFGDRMVGEGAYAEHIAQMFTIYRKRYGLTQSKNLSVEHFLRPEREQLSLL